MALEKGFPVGSFVVWGDLHPKQEKIEQYGEGPFEVVGNSFYPNVSGTPTMTTIKLPPDGKNDHFNCRWFKEHKK